MIALSGSPPRVRSRPRRSVPAYQDVGITSACAEQTEFSRDETIALRDHLRVCGADAASRAAKTANLGSPPRVRSRLVGAEM